MIATSCDTLVRRRGLRSTLGGLLVMVLSVSCVAVGSFNAQAAVAGTLSVVAGDGVSGAPTPGAATASHLSYPYGIAADLAGNVYFADKFNYEVDKIAPDATLSIVAGNGTAGSPTPGLASQSKLGGPEGVALDPAGNLYIADSANHEVDKITPAGTLSVVAGDGTDGQPSAGPATGTSLSRPRSVVVDPAGELYISDNANLQVYKVDTAGALSVVAGDAAANNPTPGPALSSSFDSVDSLALDASGNLYIADGQDEQILRMDTAGNLTVIAGNGNYGQPAPGPATSSPLNGPFGVAVDSGGSVYIADFFNHRVEMVDTTGTLSVIAGTGTAGPPTAGPATGSKLGEPLGITVDYTGHLYLSDIGNHRVLKVQLPPTPPAVPIGLGVAAGNASAVLSFTAPGDGGAPISAYQYSADAGTTWNALVTSGTTAVTADVAGLVNGNTYPIEVRAVNGQGNGHPTAVVSVSPTAPVLPPTPPPPTSPPPTSPRAPVTAPPAPGRGAVASAPLRLSVKPGNGTAVVTFARAVPRAGSRVSFYQASLNGGRSWFKIRTSGTKVLSTTITGLHPGTTYLFRVRAVTTAGAGIASKILKLLVPLPWYHDPVRPADRRRERNVPATVAAMATIRGAAQPTAAAYRAHNGAIAVPMPWAKGHHLAVAEAAVMSGDGLFAFNSPVITAAGTAQLRALVTSLSGDKRITCEGYADYAGVLAHENVLSRQRGEAVCAALTSFGATAVKIAVGYGPFRPVTVGGNGLTRTLNRRVVVYVNS